MAKKHWMDTIRYTSVGLFRMTRDGIGTFFDKAYEKGGGSKDAKPERADTCAEEESLKREE